MTQFRSTVSLLGLLAAGFALAAGGVPGAARAELAVGSVAPDFTTPSAEDGKVGAFSLKAALKQGPVVLYFYPKAFTTGCTLEAHAFAEAMGDFHKARASVMGLSNDDLPTLQKFSTAECRSKFPVGVASKAIMASYDARLTMAGVGTGYASRTTYVIGTDGKVKLAYTAMDWKEHVPRALAALKALPQGSGASGGR